MRTVFIGGLFLATLIIDGMVMPALFHVRESLLLLVFLVAMIVTFGERTWVVGYGIVISLLAELLLGLYPGTLILSFLFVLLMWHSLTRFINIKPRVDELGTNPIFHTIIGIALTAFLMVMFVMVCNVFYGLDNSFVTVKALAHQPFLWIYPSIGMAAYLLIFSRFNRIVRSMYD